MTQSKDGPRHYELQHRVAGVWRETAVYEMFPRHFRAFLDYVNKGVKPVDQENQRVVAVDTVWGNADYEFDGKSHKKIKNDNGYDPMKRQIDEKFEPTAGEIEAMLTGDMVMLDNERTTAARTGKITKPFVVEARLKSLPNGSALANLGDTVKWRFWRRYPTAKKRDSALVGLRKSHTTWDFRGVDE